VPKPADKIKVDETLIAVSGIYRNPRFFLKRGYIRPVATL